MQHVEFSVEELEVLRDVIRHQIETMDVEVFRTDTHVYKEMLKRRRAVLESVLAKLTMAPVTA